MGTQTSPTPCVLSRPSLNPDGAVAPTAAPDVLFEQAYADHRPALLRWLRARTRDDAAAEDLCQEAFARLLGQMRAGAAPDNTSAWLHRVSLNLLISSTRRQKVARARAPRMQETDGADPTADLALTRESVAELVHGIRHIPEHQRPILAMVAVGMRAAQIAQRLGTRAGAARTRLHRARRTLQARMETCRCPTL